MRRGFTRKVLAIVFLQLCVTTGISFLFRTVDPINVRTPSLLRFPTAVAPAGGCFRTVFGLNVDWYHLARLLQSFFCAFC